MFASSFRLTGCLSWVILVSVDDDDDNIEDDNEDDFEFNCNLSRGFFCDKRVISLELPVRGDDLLPSFSMDNGDGLETDSFLCFTAMGSERARYTGGCDLCALSVLNLFSDSDLHIDTMK